MSKFKSVCKNIGSGIASFFHYSNTKPGFQSFLSGIISIVLGLLISFIVMLCISPSHAAAGLGTLFSTGLTKIDSFALALKQTTPMIMSGLAIAFAFKLNLFNIGVTGQLTIGAFVSIVCGLAGANWFVCLLVAFIAGAIAGFIPGWLKAKFNVNEVLSGILLNWIIYYLIGMIGDVLPYSFKYPSTRSELNVIPSAARLPSMGLDNVLPGVSLGIIISIIFVIVIYIILNKTNFGFELKMTGLNKDASKYAGVNQTKSIILALTISGAMAGIAGYMLYADPIAPGRFRWDSSSNTLLGNGFDGISVSLIAQNSPIACIFSAFFLNLIDVAQNDLKAVSDNIFNAHYAELFQNIIIYVAALSSFIIMVIRYFNEKHDGNPFYEKMKNFSFRNLLKKKQKVPVYTASVEQTNQGIEQQNINDDNSENDSEPSSISSDHKESSDSNKQEEDNNG